MSLTKQTPLYPIHQKYNAKFVEFHHWMMPLHFGSAIQEHQSVRQDAGVFDVSHMTIIDIIGAGCRPFLRYIMTRDVDEIKHIGGACYSCMCNENGGIIDDVLIYYRAPDSYRLIFNAATKDRVIPWLNSQAQHFAVGMQLRPELCMLAIQGPHAIEKTLSILDPYQLDMVSTLKRFNSVEDQEYFFSRTGYTGEDGLECIMPAPQAKIFLEKLIAAGVKPCGLASRDSLRLEAGYMLNGQDMDETISPIACGLEWTISWKAQDREFIGKAAILQEKEQNQSPQFIGLVLDARSILRHGQAIISQNKVVGHITSGIYSPSLEKSIAFARVQHHADIQSLQVEIRQEHYPVTVTNTRFYPSSSK
jgi:aminomethyltransferase